MTHYKSELVPVSPWKFPNSSVDIFDLLPRKWQILRTYDLIPPKFHLILPKNFFFLPWVFLISSGAIGEILREKSNSSGGRCNQRGFVATV